MMPRRRRTRRRALGTLLPGRGLLPAAVFAAAAAVLAVRCADHPSVVPLLGAAGRAEVELRLVDGPLAELEQPSAFATAAAAAAPAACEPGPTGFPEDVHLTCTVLPPSGPAVIRSFDIPARSGQEAVVIEGLAPGDGYGMAVQVRVGVRRELVFEGVSAPFTVVPAGLTNVTVDLEPPFGRRAVLALGVPVFADTAISIPVFSSHSLPLRGLEFDLCFDAGVLEALGARAVGPRTGAFRGAGGQPGSEGIYHAVLWSPDPEARLAPGRDQVLEIGFRLRSPGSGDGSNLAFLGALATDSADSVGFATYFFDVRVQP